MFTVDELDALVQGGVALIAALLVLLEWVLSRRRP